MSTRSLRRKSSSSSATAAAAVSLSDEEEVTLSVLGKRAHRTFDALDKKHETRMATKKQELSRTHAQAQAQAQSLPKTSNATASQSQPVFLPPASTGFLSDAILDQMIMGEYPRTSRPVANAVDLTEDFLGPQMIRRLEDVAHATHSHSGKADWFQRVAESELHTQTHRLKLGEGTYGEVHQLADERAVLKTSQLHPSKGLPEDIVREINAYTSVDHPNVASLQGVQLELLLQDNRIRGITHTNEEEEEEEDEDDPNVKPNDKPLIGLILPLADGRDLETFCTMDVRGKGLLKSEHAVRAICLQMLSGVAALHERQIVHLDIKPSNFLVHVRRGGGLAFVADNIVAQKSESALDSMMLIQAGDMGLSTTLDGPLSGVSEVDSCYTTWYRPPEHWIGGHLYDTRSDVWALACTFFELATCGTSEKKGGDEEPVMVPLCEFNTADDFAGFCLDAFGSNGRGVFSIERGLLRQGSVDADTTHMHQYLVNRLGIYQYNAHDKPRIQRRKSTYPWYSWSSEFQSWFLTLLVRMLRFDVQQRPSAHQLISLMFPVPTRQQQQQKQQRNAWPQPSRFAWFRSEAYRPRIVDWSTYVRNLRYTTHVAISTPAAAINQISAAALETRIFERALEFALRIAYGMNVNINTWLLCVLLIERTILPFIANKRFVVSEVSKESATYASLTAALKHLRGAKLKAARHAINSDQGDQSVKRWVLSCLRIAACIKEPAGYQIQKPRNVAQKDWSGVSEEDVSIRAGFLLPELEGYRETRAQPFDPALAWFRALDDAWLLERLGGHVTLFDRWSRCADGHQVQVLFLNSFRRQTLISYLADMQSASEHGEETASMFMDVDQDTEEKLRCYFGNRERANAIRCTSTICDLLACAPPSSPIAHIIPDFVHMSDAAAADTDEGSIHVSSLARLFIHE
jgi:serine/threonine protein kinase